MGCGTGDLDVSIYRNTANTVFLDFGNGDDDAAGNGTALNFAGQTVTWVVKAGETAAAAAAANAVVEFTQGDGLAITTVADDNGNEFSRVTVTTTTEEANRFATGGAYWFQVKWGPDPGTVIQERTDPARWHVEEGL